MVWVFQRHCTDTDFGGERIQSVTNKKKLRAKCVKQGCLWLLDPIKCTFAPNQRLLDKFAEKLKTPWIKTNFLARGYTDMEKKMDKWVADYKLYVTW
jgi:hypothetical protein